MEKKHEWRKHEKTLYVPKEVPTLINVLEYKYITIKGHGSPEEERFSHCITALYSFRMFFLVFHGQSRVDKHTRAHLHESPLVVTVPLILLAIPSVMAGWIFIEPMLFGDFSGPQGCRRLGPQGFQCWS